MNAPARTRKQTEKYSGRPCGKCGGVERYKGGHCIACLQAETKLAREWQQMLRRIERAIGLYEAW